LIDVQGGGGEVCSTFNFTRGKVPEKGSLSFNLFRSGRFERKEKWQMSPFGLGGGGGKERGR